MTRTATPVPALDVLPPGHPVVVRWGHALPANVGVGGADQPTLAYNLDGESVVYEPGGSAYVRPEVVEVPRIEEADYGVLYGAEKVAERHADSLAYRATASVGVIRDLTDEETLRLVADARHARRVAWGYSVIASARRHGDDPGPRALEYVTGWREALA